MLSRAYITVTFLTNSFCSITRFCSKSGQSQTLLAQVRFIKYFVFEELWIKNASTIRILKTDASQINEALSLPDPLPPYPHRHEKNPVYFNKVLVSCIFPF